MPITNRVRRMAAAPLAAAAISTALVASLPATAAAVADECSQASSEDMGFAYTSHGRGDAYFAAYGEHLYVNDFNSDGMRTEAVLQMCIMRNGNPTWVTQVERDSGPNEGVTDSEHYNLSFAEGKRLRLRACDDDGTSCGSWHYGAA